MENNKKIHETELDLGFDFLNQMIEEVRKTDWGQKNDTSICRKCGDVLYYQGEKFSICGSCAG